MESPTRLPKDLEEEAGEEEKKNPKVEELKESLCLAFVHDQGHGTDRTPVKSSACQQRRPIYHVLTYPFAFPIGGLIKKPAARNISANEFFSNSFCTANQLAITVTGQYALPLRNICPILKYLSSMRCRFTDQAVLLFDDEFRRLAKSEKFQLDDQEKRPLSARDIFSPQTAAPHAVKICPIKIFVPLGPDTLTPVVSVFRTITGRKPAQNAGTVMYVGTAGHLVKKCRVAGGSAFVANQRR